MTIADIPLVNSHFVDPVKWCIPQFEYFCKFMKEKKGITKTSKGLSFSKSLIRRY